MKGFPVAATVLLSFFLVGSSSVESCAADSLPSDPKQAVKSAAPIAAQEDVDFGPYMADLQRRVRRAWFPPSGKESKRVVVIWKVHRDGNASNIRIDRSSGNVDCDKAAAQAVENAAPFHALPSGSPNLVDIQFTFDYNVFQTGGKSTEAQLKDKIKKLGANAKSDELAEAWADLGDFYRYSARNDDLAIAPYAKALEVLKNDKNSRRTQFAAFSTDLGDIYYNKKDYRNSEKLFRQALDCLLEMPSPADKVKQIAEARRDLGFSLFYNDEADYLDECKSLFEDALVGAQECNDAELIFDVKDGLAKVNIQKGDFSAALPLLKELLFETEKKEQVEPSDVTQRVSDLADCHYEMGQYNEALAMYNRVLANLDTSTLTADEIEAAKDRHEELCEKLGLKTSKQVMQEKAKADAINRAYSWLPYAFGGSLVALLILYIFGNKQNSVLDITGKKSRS